MSSAPAPESDLISLRRASELLGVHPATARVWADQGKLKATRTAGGHRRFSLKAVRAFAARQQPPHEKENAELIMHSALGRARMELTGGGMGAQAWYQHYDEATRERHRELGRKLLGLMMHYLGAQDEPAQTTRILREARKVGAQYGAIAVKQGLSLSDAMRAFLFFRDFLLESVVQMHEVVGSVGADALTTYRLVNGFANEVLIAMVATHQEK